MKLTHVVPGVGHEASGTSYVVPRLCLALAEAGHEVNLVSIGQPPPVAHASLHLETHRSWRWLHEVSLGAAWSVARHADDSQVVHGHGLWSMLNVATGLVVPGRSARLVVSPHGTLAPWALARSAWKKRLVWPLQAPLLQETNVVHVTSPEEAAHARNAGVRCPIAVVPNAVDVPGAAEHPRRPEVLFLSRIHPTKGLDLLLHAWREVAPLHPEWSLRVVGTGTPEYEREMRELTSSLAIPRVMFSGPLYGAEKVAAYQQASVFILPTHTENFGMVVAEALAAGTPAIVTRGAPWQGLESEGCGAWVQSGVPELAAALDRMLQRPQEELRVMGERGRKWMARDFSWEVVATKMTAVYHWILGEADAPGWVAVD